MILVEKSDIIAPTDSSGANQILDGERPLPDWMTFGRTELCQKDLAKGNAAGNYRPISCLTFMWKLMTGILTEKMYSHSERENVLASEQKGCHKRESCSKRPTAN